MNAADWLATDEGHAWIDATFPPHQHTGHGLYQLKDDLAYHEAACAEARWRPPGTPAREGADVPAAQNSASR